MLKKFAIVDETQINNKFFIDQPRTVILKPKKILPSSLYWPENKVAFRICTIPEIAQKIIYPITATSANISGAPSPLFYSDIQDYIKTKVDYVVNLEQQFNTINKASTIIKLEKSGEYTIIRE